MRRILLIEDDRGINEANQTALELEGYDVCTARTMKAGISLCEEFHPDLILLDIILPDANALDYGTELKKRYGVNILYLSGLNTKEDVIRGLRAGGDDYMTKPYMVEELLLRVASLLRRKDQPVIREDFTTGRLTWHTAAKQFRMDGEELMLQPKEYAVLEYLQRSKTRYVSTEELAERIWLTEEDSAITQSIRNTVHTLRQKLEGSGCGTVTINAEGVPNGYHGNKAYFAILSETHLPFSCQGNINITSDAWAAAKPGNYTATLRVQVEWH